MTISLANSSPLQYAGNGTSVTFSFPWKIFAASDLVVGFITGGVYSQQTLGFTVSGVGNNGGGSVTFSTAPPLNTTVDLRPLTPETQPTEFANLAPYLPENTTNAADRLTRTVQDLYRLTYTFGFHALDQEFTPWTPLPGPAARANTVAMFDANGLPTVGVPLAGTLTQATFNAMYAVSPQSTFNTFLGGSPPYAQTAAELAASVTPINLQYFPGNVNRYGTNTTPGTTDMTLPFQAAFAQSAQGGANVYAPSGIYLITGQLIIGSYVRFYGDGSDSQIQFSSTGALDNLLGSNITGSSVQDLYFNSTGTASPTGLYCGAVAFRGTTNCRVERCEFSGGYFCGVVIAASTTQNSVSNAVVGNYFHNATNTTQDSADIHVDCTVGFGAQANVIEKNQCYGGNNWHGISLEASTNPNGLMSRNVVSLNRVGQHTGYGILLYTHTPGDTYNEVIANYVENIQGTSLGGAAGTGIYVAGMSAVTVANNTVVNCCVLSSSQFNQGGITILSGFTGSPNTVTGNAVYDMAQANSAVTMAGISVLSTPSGTVVTGNLVSQQQAGGGSAYSGIQISGGNSGVAILGNAVNILNTIANSRGIYLLANNSNLTNITVSGNQVLGCAARGVSLEQVGITITSGVTINGNEIAGGASGATPLFLTAAADVACSGNTALANTGVALYASNVTDLRCAGNVLKSTGTYAIQTAGTCTGGLLDYSNSLGGNVNNGGTGFIVETIGTAQPASGTWALGDTVRNSSPSNGGVYMWVCSVPGTPGNFRTISNS
jgi:Pectate lyase superfamily protein